MWRKHICLIAFIFYSKHAPRNFWPHFKQNIASTKCIKHAYFVDAPKMDLWCSIQTLNNFLPPTEAQEVLSAYFVRSFVRPVQVCLSSINQSIFSFLGQKAIRPLKLDDSYSRSLLVFRLVLQKILISNIISSSSNIRHKIRMNSYHHECLCNIGQTCDNINIFLNTPYIQIVQDEAKKGYFLFCGCFLCVVQYKRNRKVNTFTPWEQFSVSGWNCPVQVPASSKIKFWPYLT